MKKRIGFKMELIKKIVVTILTLGIVITSSGRVFGMEAKTAQYDVNDAGATISQMFDAVDIQDWDTFTNLMCREEKLFFQYYFSEDQLTDGVKQVTDAELVNIYEVDNSLAKDEWLTEDYPVLETNTDIYSAVAEVNCRVSKENQFFFNGVNYFLIVLVREGDNFRVVQFNRPSIDLIEKAVQPLLAESTDIYQEELKGIEVLEAAEYGLAVNADNEIITDGFTTVTEETDAGVMPFAADPPVINHYTSYSYPTSLKVLLDKTGNNKIVTVGFTDYMKHVLPNEWRIEWNAEALKAGAYCVKMVGIYFALKPKNSAAGYNLSQGTQNYLPNNGTYASTSNAIDSIKNRGMANTSGRLFCPCYGLGTWDDPGKESSGHLKQRGSQQLASQGYTHQQILNYYYSGSDYSSGNLNFFSYNIGY